MKKRIHWMIWKLAKHKKESGLGFCYVRTFTIA